MTTNLQPDQSEQNRPAPILCSDLLAALDRFNDKHKSSRGYHTLTLYADGSGFLVDPYGDRMMSHQFDTVQAALEMLQAANNH